MNFDVDTVDVEIPVHFLSFIFDPHVLEVLIVV
jgi:hypothetical protein